jgi:hypothetical protein
MSNSSVECFGDAVNGGKGPPGNANHNIVAVFGGAKAFAALTKVNSGDPASLMAWGSSYAGGNVTAVPSSKQSGISIVYGTTIYRSNSDEAQIYACDTGSYGYAYRQCTPCGAGTTTQYGASASTAAACISPVPSTQPTPMPSFAPTPAPTEYPTAFVIKSTVKKSEKVGIAVGAVCGIAILMFGVYYGCYSKDENVTIGPNMLKRKMTDGSIGGAGAGAGAADESAALAGGGKSKNPLHNRDHDLL